MKDKKKHLLIIGGTKGLGLEILNYYCNTKKFNISVIGMSKKLSKIKNNKLINYFPLDITNYDLVDSEIDKIIKKNKKITDLIFCQQYRGKEDDWKLQFETSITATKNIIDYINRKNYLENKSSISIIGSIASILIASEQPLSYHISKNALIQIAKFYSIKFAKKNIIVNVFSPTAILKKESKKFYKKNKKFFDLMNNTNPHGRMLESKEIVRTIYLFSSIFLPFITGQNIIIDGGVSLQSHESLSRKISNSGSLKITQNKKNDFNK